MSGATVRQLVVFQSRPVSRLRSTQLGRSSAHSPPVTWGPQVAAAVQAPRQQRRQLAVEVGVAAADLARHPVLAALCR